MPDITNIHTQFSGDSSSASTSYTQIGLILTDFVPGDDYLLWVTARIGVSTNVAGLASIHLIHGTTEFAGSEFTTTVAAVDNRVSYSFATVWNAVSGEGVNAEYKTSNASDAAHVADFTLVAIRLSDLAATDWQFADNHSALSLSTTPQDGASVTFTPNNNNDDWLVLTGARFTVATTLLTFITRQNESVGATVEPDLSREADSTSSKLNQLCAQVYSLSNASHTIKEQAFTGNTAVAGDQRTDSMVFCLRLDAFDTHSFAYTSALLGSLSTTDFGSTVQTVTHTPSATGDQVVFSSWKMTPTGTTQTWKWRQQIDNADAPASQTSALFLAKPEGASERPPMQEFVLTSLTAAAHTIDADGSNSGANASRGAAQRFIVAFSMLLATAAVSQPYSTVPLTALLGAAALWGETADYRPPQAWPPQHKQIAPLTLPRGQEPPRYSIARPTAIRWSWPEVGEPTMPQLPQRREIVTLTLPTGQQPPRRTIAPLSNVRAIWPEPEAFHDRLARRVTIAPLTLRYGDQPPSYSVAPLMLIRQAWPEVGEPLLPQLRPNSLLAPLTLVYGQQPPRQPPPRPMWIEPVWQTQTGTPAAAWNIPPPAGVLAVSQPESILAAWQPEPVPPPERPLVPLATPEDEPPRYDVAPLALLRSLWPELSEPRPAQLQRTPWLAGVLAPPPGGTGFSRLHLLVAPDWWPAQTGARIAPLTLPTGDAPPPRPPSLLAVRAWDFWWPAQSAPESAAWNVAPVAFASRAQPFDFSTVAEWEAEWVFVHAFGTGVLQPPQGDQIIRPPLTAPLWYPPEWWTAQEAPTLATAAQPTGDQPPVRRPRAPWRPEAWWPAEAAPESASWNVPVLGFVPRARPLLPAIVATWDVVWGAQGSAIIAPLTRPTGDQPPRWRPPQVPWSAWDGPWWMAQGGASNLIAPLTLPTGDQPPSRRPRAPWRPEAWWPAQAAVLGAPSLPRAADQPPPFKPFVPRPEELPAALQRVPAVAALLAPAPAPPLVRPPLLLAPESWPAQQAPRIAPLSLPTGQQPPPRLYQPLLVAPEWWPAQSAPPTAAWNVAPPAWQTFVRPPLLVPVEWWPAQRAPWLAPLTLTYGSQPGPRLLSVPWQAEPWWPAQRASISTAWLPAAPAQPFVRPPLLVAPEAWPAQRAALVAPLTPRAGDQPPPFEPFVPRPEEPPQPQQRQPAVAAVLAPVPPPPRVPPLGSILDAWQPGPWGAQARPPLIQPPAGDRPPPARAQPWSAAEWWPAQQAEPSAGWNVPAVPVVPFARPRIEVAAEWWPAQSAPHAVVATLPTGQAPPVRRLVAPPWWPAEWWGPPPLLGVTAAKLQPSPTLPRRVPAEVLLAWQVAWSAQRAPLGAGWISVPPPDRPPPRRLTAPIAIYYEEWGWAGWPIPLATPHLGIEAGSFVVGEPTVRLVWFPSRHALRFDRAIHDVTFDAGWVTWDGKWAEPNPHGGSTAVRPTALEA